MFQTFRAFFNWYTFIFSIYRVTKYFACSFCYSSVLIFVIVTLLHSKSFLQNCNVSLCCVFHTCLPKIKKLMSYNFKPSRHKYSLLEVLTCVCELKTWRLSYFKAFVWWWKKILLERTFLLASVSFVMANVKWREIWNEYFNEKIIWLFN